MQGPSLMDTHTRYTKDADPGCRQFFIISFFYLFIYFIFYFLIFSINFIHLSQKTLSAGEGREGGGKGEEEDGLMMMLENYNQNPAARRKDKGLPPGPIVLIATRWIRTKIC